MSAASEAHNRTVRLGDPPVGGRYELVEPFGADERFAGGQVQTWRARDTVIERDVVLRVLTPGGNSARLFLDRALEMSLIADPGLGVVYEAVDLGEYAIVVSEWVTGTSLRDTLRENGPLSPAAAREGIGVVADAISEAHRAGLPIGGITPERVVLSADGSIKLTAVPALFADERGDIQQLGQLLYTALTGAAPDLDDPELARHLHRRIPRDLATLCQRALDPEPATQLGSVAAFAAVLRPHARESVPSSRQDPPTDTAGRAGGRLRVLDGPDPAAPTYDTAPAGFGPADDTGAPSPVPTTADGTGTDPLAAGGQATNGAARDSSVSSVDRSSGVDEITAGPRSGAAANPDTDSDVLTDMGAHTAVGESRIRAGYRPYILRDGPVDETAHHPAGSDTSSPESGPAWSQEYDPWEGDDVTWGGYGGTDVLDDLDEATPARRKVLLYAVPIVAFLLVVLMAVFVGRQFGSVVGDESDGGAAGAGGSAGTNDQAATDTVPPATEATPSSEAPVGAVALPPVGVEVYDPFGDGALENNDDAGLTLDGDVGSAWQTLEYQNTPEFGNLKPGVGLIFDLGQEYTLSSVELATTLPGTAIEIRVGAAPAAALDSYRVAGTLDPFPDAGSVTFAEPVRARFVIVWFVRLVDSGGGFRGDLSEARFLGA